MGNDAYENKIKSSLTHIAKTLVNQREEINTNLEQSLSTRLERSDFNEVKYMSSLKFNVIFYKVSTRNRELLLLKWIESGNIPDKNARDAELDKLVKKSRDYVQNGTKSGGKTFNERDLKSLLAYKNIEKTELRQKLESDYKALNVYNDVLSIFINDLSIEGVEDLHCQDMKSVFKTIKLELNKATNFIVKSFDSCKNEKIEKEEQFIKVLNEISGAKLTDKMERTYQELCTLEEIKYYKGYGFGKEGIKEYIASIGLLNLVDEKESILLRGAIRLLIGGEFGANNFKELVGYIATKKINISEAVWKQGLNIIENNHKFSMENELSERRFKESKCIDMEEYIYILENTDGSSKYRRDSKEFDIEEEVNDEIESKNNQYITNEEKISDNDKSSSNKINTDNIDNRFDDRFNNRFNDRSVNKNGKKIAIICVAVVVGIVIGAGGLAMSGVFNNDNKDNDNNDDVSYNPPVEDSRGYEDDYEDDYEEIEQEEEILAYSDDYIIEDSDSRYLTIYELQNYSDSQLGYIRNEIFARYGFVFKSKGYKEYFNSKHWYTPDYSFKGDTNDFNDYERANIKLIYSLEYAGE